MNADPTTNSEYDVVIIGGALSGAATAILLLREKPALRILIVEKSLAFTRKVGEATVEISTYFLTHSLGLARHLNESHLNKQGLRFWFANDRTKTLADCSEIGGRYLARVPAYLVDRAVLDEEVLRRAVEMGAKLWRAAVVQKVELTDGGNQKVVLRYQEKTEMLETRWVVDASGVTALLARQEGWWRSNKEHPTVASWSRWRGVKDLDGLELAKKFPAWAKECYGARSTATNHLMGDGWWAWIIPLKGGDVSIGVVFDKRRMTWPENGTVGRRIKDFLMQHPVGAELMADAEWVEGDLHCRKNLPYYTTTYVGDGFSLVGDASAFLDPFYSPGMDWIAFTTSSTAKLIVAQLNGEPIADKVKAYNRTFVRSYQRWFEAIYQDKYEYIGDFELTKLAFLMDLGLYYVGVASQPFKRGAVGLTEPVYSTPPSVPVFYFMRAYNRRFAKIAQSRRARNCHGCMNDGRRYLFPGFTFSPGSMMPIFKAMLRWAMIELKEGWRTWFQKREPSPMPDLTRKMAMKTVAEPL